MKKTGIVLLILNCLSWQAQATKYAVKFLNPSTFRQVSQEFAQVSRSEGKDFELFSTGVKVEESLDQLQMIIVDSGSSRAIQSLAFHPTVAFLEEEHFFSIPPTPFGERGDEPASLQFPNTRPWGIDAIKAPAVWEKGFKGNSVRVAVLDSGIDRDHPSLKDNFEEGRNFVWNSNSDTSNDFSDKVGHGTHVSGIIAASMSEGGFSGVAPEAHLLMGRVCDTRCSSLAIVRGVNWVIEKKADVLNLSLASFWPDSAIREALKSADAIGVTVVAASGNDGKQSVSYPAAFDFVLAVGAIDHDLKKADFSNWGPELDVVAPGVDVLSSVPQGKGRKSIVQVAGQEVPSLAFDKSKEIYDSISGSVIFAGMGRPEDFVGVDCKDKIVLISRGEINFGDKVKNALQAQAKAVFIFNNQPGLLKGTLSQADPINLPAAMIDQEQGQKLVSLLAGGGSVEASYVVQKTDYDSLQGTSMASPHVAGVAALIKSANKSLTPQQVRDIIVKTAIVPASGPSSQYGSGVVDALAGVNAALSL